jgi:hypothetical protein
MDKKAKKAMRDAVRQQQRMQARAAFPLPVSELKLLFDTLDVELPRQPCDHTRRLTKQWIESRGHDVEAVFEWLDDNGGYCDCEVLFNSEQNFKDAIHDSVE